MVLFPTHTVRGTQAAVKGVLFGARGGSCSCDPCDCNPCKCGDSVASNPPLWRVSGCAIKEGSVGQADMTHLVLLSLAQPRADGTWEEILLVEKQATVEQVAGLLALFEEELESLPAEIGPLPRVQRAVYRVPLDYRPDAARPLLRVTLAHDSIICVRPSKQDECAFPREWSYDGPMALRGSFERLP
jgi:hypothetical protein